MSQAATASVVLSRRAADEPPELSIVVPALNEQDNVRPLVEQVELSILQAGIDAELIVVDDGST
ncbi:MAG TPA: glycosyltransferase, partial [Phycisphaeraceae bacterium]